MQAIQLRGVRTRNLRGFDVSFRLGTWTNVLGVSGSGKTSLCFHTLHALAQHWFLSAMAPAARMLLEEIPHPVLDAAHGLIPTLALEQGQERIGPRMRAMDVAGVDLPLRSLMVACGQAVSPVTGQVLRSWIPAEIADWLIEHCLGVKVQALFPVGKHTAGYWMQRGFTRAVVAGDACELEDPSRELAASDWIVVDRLVAEGKYRQRLGEAMGLCLASGGGRGAVLVMEVTGSRIVEFSDHPRCPESDREVPRATMGALSPNSVQGACPDCAGTGLVEERPCPGCDGHGLGEASRWVRLGGLSMPDMLALSFREMSAWLASSGLLEHPQEAIRQTASELAGRFDCLDRLGLGYLQIGRKAHALSFGEHHRLKLALLTGYPLSGVCYVLDEPSTGLHPSDASRMQEHLKALVGAGNTLVVVEHRLRDLAGDRVVEIGPGPGGEGGDLVFNGDLTEFVKSDSPSAILGRRSLSPSGPVPREFLRLEGATGRNLKGAGLDVALGGVTGVCGPSGAGKSSLVMDTLVPAMQRRSGLERLGLPFGSLTGGDAVTTVEVVDPSEESVANLRSMVVTLAGILDPLRKLMASLPVAKAQGFSAARFSPNLKGGRCEPCQGLGKVRIELPYLPASWSECPYCKGLRFSPEILEVRWRGLNLGQILSMTCREALVQFQAHPALRDLLEPLVRAGLGYVPLGFASSELSGGEIARIRLCVALGRKSAPTLFVLEEPTRGLHPTDTQVLFELLRGLVDKGHSVLAISHDPGFLARCDWICEIGPGAGPDGGVLLKSASPLEISGGDTLTAKSLRREYGRSP